MLKSTLLERCLLLPVKAKATNPPRKYKDAVLSASIWRSYKGKYYLGDQENCKQSGKSFSGKESTKTSSSSF